MFAASITAGEAPAGDSRRDAGATRTGATRNLCCLWPFFAQKFAKNTDSLVHMLFLQEERWEKTHDRVLRAVEQHSLRESLLDDRARGDVEVDALNEAAPTYFLRGGVTVYELLKFMLKICSDFIDIGQQIFFFDNGQVLESDARGERPAAEGGAMLAGGNRACEFFAREKCSEGKPGRNWLGDGNDVGLHAKCLEGEQVAGSAQTALDFVEDEGGLAAVGESAAFLEKLDRALHDSALSEDGLEHDGAGLVVDGGAQGFDIVARNEGDFFQQRLESLAVFVLPGQRHRAESSTMVGTFESDEAAFLEASDAMTGEAGELDRALDRLGAAVGKENAVETGERG